MAFQNKVVIVTGSSSGIGQDCALLFADEGAFVTIHGQNESRIKETEELLKRANVSESRWLSVLGSIEDDKVQKELIEKTVKKFGHIDVLINNAGVSHRSDLHPESAENLDYVLDVNLKSVVKLTQMAVPLLAKTTGNIVNISSIYGQRGTASLSQYAMCKAAIDSFTKNAAIAYGPLGVRVNAVSPGAIESRFGSRHGGDPTLVDAAYKTFIDRTVPLGRKGLPREVSNTVRFLANNDRASYVTGANYLVDGGSMAGQF